MLAMPMDFARIISTKRVDISQRLSNLVQDFGQALPWDLPSSESQLIAMWMRIVPSHLSDRHCARQLQFTAFALASSPDVRRCHNCKYANISSTVPVSENTFACSRPYLHAPQRTTHQFTPPNGGRDLSMHWQRRKTPRGPTFSLGPSAYSEVVNSLQRGAPVYRAQFQLQVLCPIRYWIDCHLVAPSTTPSPSGMMQPKSVGQSNLARRVKNCGGKHTSAGAEGARNDQPPGRELSGILNYRICPRCFDTRWLESRIQPMSNTVAGMPERLQCPSG
jgi:hypothetical protein